MNKTRSTMTSDPSDYEIWVENYNQEMLAKYGEKKANIKVINS